MCGICGMASLDGRLDPELRAALPAMTTALQHRGPDGAGLFDDGFAALGHRRLSIIDVAGGRQPISNEDGTRWIVFNGEVYNHHELRGQLESLGHRFRTASDTEAILHAYEQWGPASVERLEGMFAFAIYDATSRELFVARDRLGKKPLFYAVLGGALHFASEMKALAVSPAWDGTIDAGALEEYFALGYVIAPGTIYRRVQKLEPGCWLRLSSGRIETRRYWDIDVFDSPVSRRQADEELESLIRSRVEERLESEVPLGAFLSGGVDSGLVVSYMADALSRPVVTTSVGFGSSGHNELSAAGLTASAFGTSHNTEVVEPRLDEVLDRIVEAFDEPFADSSAVPTYYVSQMARRHVTVALSGDGGDEVFGGYSFRYIPHAAESYARSMSGSAGRRAFGWMGARWPRSARLPRPLRLATVFENIARSGADAYYHDLCFMKPHAARALAGLPPVSSFAETRAYEAVTGPYRCCPSPDAAQKAMYADVKVYLPNDVLVKVDRMSMAHGLEVRCPLLDRRIVEFGFRVPQAVKMPGLRPKRLLRALAARRLPSALARMPKRGFTAPVGEWIAGAAAGRFQSDVFSGGSASSAFLDLNVAKTLFAEHRAGRADHAYALWAIWMFERWHRGTQRQELKSAAQMRECKTVLP